MKQWRLVDNTILEKTWATEENAPLFSDLATRLQSEIAVDVSPGALDVKVVSSTIHRVSSLYELANLIEVPEWATSHLPELLELRIECEAYNRRKIAVLSLRTLNRGLRQVLLSWYIDYLDASTGEIIALSKRLASLDLSSILVATK